MTLNLITALGKAQEGRKDENDYLIEHSKKLIVGHVCVTLLVAVDITISDTSYWQRILSLIGKINIIHSSSKCLLGFHCASACVSSALLSWGRASWGDGRPSSPRTRLRSERSTETVP